MTALSPTEQAALDRIEHVPLAPESAIDRVARAIHDPEGHYEWTWHSLDRVGREDYYRRARSALAAMSGPGTTATYPHQSGEVTVIGPECFASADEVVISWRGKNYYTGLTKARAAMSGPDPDTPPSPCEEPRSAELPPAGNRGGSAESDSSQGRTAADALARVAALADELEADSGTCEEVASAALDEKPYSLARGRSHAYQDSADRIRAAIAGGDQ